MARQVQKRKWQLKESIILSLALHALFVLTTFLVPILFPAPPAREIVEMNFVTLPEPNKPYMEPEEKKQVVEQPEHALNDEIDPKAKFLSEHNQVVKKETAATDLGEFKNRKKAGKRGRAAKMSLMDLTPQKLDLQKIVEKQRQHEIEIEKSLDDSAVAFNNPKKSKAATKNDELDFNSETPGADASQTNDYLKDVDKGAETLLSTREFVYYSFYARIRRQLNQHWGGKVREKLTKIFREGRTIASTDDKITKVLITLNRRGDLVRVQVLNDSGIRDLDEAAVEAFKEAAPFPNPPDGIVEPDGTIKIRWDFILEA
jgi:TonB family protein